MAARLLAGLPTGLIVALDTADPARAGEWAAAVAPHCGLFKLGLEFFVANGPAGVRELGRPVFLDLKLHDIPNTVAGAVRAVLPLAARMLTIHAAGGAAMIEAARHAAEAAGAARPLLLAVTVLTSLDAGALIATGVIGEPAQQVVRLGRLAISAGADGLVCSAHEVAAAARRAWRQSHAGGSRHPTRRLRARRSGADNDAATGGRGRGRLDRGRASDHRRRGPGGGSGDDRGRASMTVRVKICGINDAAAFDAAVAAGADWVGFVFFPPSPRAVAPALAARLSARAAGGPGRVGLFVDPADDAVAAALAALRLDALQVYASPERVAALRHRFGLPVWRALGISAAADVPLSAGGGRPICAGGEAAARRDPTGGQCGPLRLVDVAWLAGAGPLDPGGRSDTGQCGVGDPRDGGRGGGCVLRRGIRPGHKGSGADPGIHRRCPKPVITLRPATQADVLPLASAHVQAWRETYKGIVPDHVLAALDPAKRAARWRGRVEGGGTVRLGVDAEGIAGFADAGAQRDASLPFAGEIYAIYVLRRAQRRGLGRRLMGAMAHQLGAAGFPGASLWVAAANAPARRFYEALDGRLVGQRTETPRTETPEDWQVETVAYGWDDLSRFIPPSIDLGTPGP